MAVKPVPDGCRSAAPHLDGAARALGGSPVSLMVHVEDVAAGRARTACREGGGGASAAGLPGVRAAR